jgi:16S rRNA (guanine527-N7)-methyltransferase
MTDLPVDLSTRVTRVVEGLLDGRPPKAVLDALTTWVALVASWNARIDLTAARSEDELCDLMLADAAVLAQHLPPDARVVDVGSGAGAPGLGLALLRPDLRVTLVEPLQRRVAFLRTVIGSVRLEAARPEVVRGRGEDLVGRAPFAVATSRATLSPAAWLELGAKLAPAGDVWVLVAREEPPTTTGRTIAEDLRYVWPLTGADRRAVRYTAVRETAARDPKLAPS